MKVILENILPQQVNFCGYEVIAVLLNRFGINFIRDVLGIEWGFEYIRDVGKGIGIDYEKWVPEYFFTSEVSGIREIIKGVYGYEFKMIKANTYEEICIHIIKYLNSGYPLIINCDPIELPYFDEYKINHAESPHYVLVYGYDNKKKIFYYMDSFRGHIEGIYHQATFENMRYLFIPKDNIFHLNNSFLVLQKNRTSITDRTFSHFYKSLMQMEGQDTNGFHAMHNLAEDLKLISKWGTQLHINYYKRKFESMSVLVCQQRRGNYLYILNCDEINSEELVNKVRNIYKLWNNFKMCFHNVRRFSDSKVLFNASIILEDLITREREFIECIFLNVNLGKR